MVRQGRDSYLNTYYNCSSTGCTTESHINRVFFQDKQYSLNRRGDSNPHIRQYWSRYRSSRISPPYRRGDRSNQYNEQSRYDSTYPSQGTNSRDNNADNTYSQSPFSSNESRNLNYQSQDYPPALANISEPLNKNTTLLGGQ